MFSHFLALISIPFVFEASDLYTKLVFMLLERLVDWGGGGGGWGVFRA